MDGLYTFAFRHSCPSTQAAAWWGPCKDEMIELVSEISLKGLVLATMFEDEPLEPSRLLGTPDRIDRSLSPPTTS